MHWHVLTITVLSVFSLAYAPASASPVVRPAHPRVNAVLYNNTNTASAPRGKVFQYFMQIWLENENYETVVNLPTYQELAKQGILLSNYDGFTHPSQPNYIAAVGGDTLGITDNEFHTIPADVTHIFDLVEEKGLTWKAYNEQLPAPGWKGKRSLDKLYVRKHNPAISFDSIALNFTRLMNVVPADFLLEDIAEHKVPAYSFYTPNMVNDGHNSDSTVAGEWLLEFVDNVLNNAAFMEEALVLLTFDESLPSAPCNHIWSCLIGGAIPRHLRGSIDNTYYTHYSALRTVEINWDLGSLGRGDVGANIFQFVADNVGHTNEHLSLSDNSKPTSALRAIHAGLRIVILHLSKLYTSLSE
ncbi:hypothetical protein APHAL10511_003314 [Amanita phalloides]|nr:hypothetical protein APHAL10511_003314 [Amanita phalloides]